VKIFLKVNKDHSIKLPRKVREKTGKRILREGAIVDPAMLLDEDGNKGRIKSLVKSGHLLALPAAAKKIPVDKLDEYLENLEKFTPEDVNSLDEIQQHSDKRPDEEVARKVPVSITPRFDKDPAKLEGKSLDELNTMIAEIDADMLADSVEDAVAILSSDR